MSDIGSAGNVRNRPIADVEPGQLSWIMQPPWITYPDIPCGIGPSGTTPSSTGLSLAAMAHSFAGQTEGLMKVRSLIAMLGALLAISGCAPRGEPLATALDGTLIYSRSFTPTDRDGAATINCAIGEDRKLTDCRVVSETPEGMGYGSQALASAANARVSDAQLAGTRADFGFRFRKLR